MTQGLKWKIYGGSIVFVWNERHPSTTTSSGLPRAIYVNTYSSDGGSMNLPMGELYTLGTLNQSDAFGFEIC